MKTIAQQLNVKKFPFIVKDIDGNQTYYEDSDGSWWKEEFDSKGNKIYFEDSDGYWSKREFDSECNEIYFEDSDGFWTKREFDSKGNKIYFEDSDGEITDKRKVELTLDEIAKKFNVDVNNLKIKK